MIAYDIADDRRRLRVSHALLRYGERVQKSVYEAYLSPREMGALQRELRNCICEESDRIRFYPLCRRDRANVRVDGHGTEVLRDEPYRLV